MARKRSLWSKLQRERERRTRAARARERTQRQMVRQMVQDAERAERRAERADAAERRRQEQLAHEAGAAAAQEMKAQLDAHVAELKTLLTLVLARPPRLSFAELKQPVVPLLALARASSRKVTVAAAWSRGGQAQHLCDYVAERLGGPDLMIGRFAQPRLDRPQIIQNALQLTG
jgi:hypothetical protein